MNGIYLNGESDYNITLVKTLSRLNSYTSIVISIHYACVWIRTFI